MRRNVKSIAALFAFLATSVLTGAENHYGIYCYDNSQDGTISIVSSSESNGKITEVTINGRSLEDLREDGLIKSYSLNKNVAKNGDPIKITITPDENFSVSKISSIAVETHKGTALSGSCSEGYYETSLKISVVRDLEQNQVKVNVINNGSREQEMEKVIVNGKDVTRNLLVATRNIKPNQKVSYVISTSLIDDSIEDTAVVVLAQ